MQKSILAIYSLLLLIQIGGKTEYLAPEKCQEAQEWPLNGRELIRDYKGRVLLLTFISLKKCNPECELAFRRLDSLHDHFSSIRVLAISPKNESPSELRAFAWRFPRIRFEHENEISPIWKWFNATHLDQFIFDRCSRHTSKLSPSNQMSPPSYSSTSESLKSALTAQPCGLCEYDPAKPLPKWPSLHPPIPTKNKNKNVQMEYKKAISKTPMIIVNTGLMTSFSTEIGSPKDGAQKQLAFVEQRAVGSNYNNNRQRESSKYQQRLPYGALEQNRQDSVAVHSYPPQQAQSSSQLQPHPRDENNPQNQQNVNSQTQMTQQQLQRQREELAHVQQQQMEREKLLREHEERLRPRQIMEEQQRRYWAEQQERQRQIQQQQQQHFPTSPNAAPAPFHPQQPQQNQPIQNVEQSQQNIRQIQQPAPVHYANDPYGDRYRFGLSQANNNNRIRHQQRTPSPQQQQRQISIPSDAQQPATRMLNSPQIPPSNVGFQSHQMMAPTEGAAPLYPEGSENDYYGYDDEWTTETPSMLQIPRPTKQTAPTTPSMQQQDKNFGFELPCTGFSDESCFQQQTQLRPNEVHRCCRGRILFTDQCIHGKCSNMTTQLCCIQRFLQAKLTCCSDERQAETGVGDHFSRCCFDNFVDSDDLCCPREYAAEQWRSVHELCLPNVEMDLSAVKVPIPLFGTSLITEFDFSKTDKWRFECRYGGHVQQYSFFEKSASEEDESEGGGEID